MVDGDGRSRVGGVAARPVVATSCGGGAPAALGGGGWVVEHRWEVGELVGESIWVEEGRKRGVPRRAAVGGGSARDGGTRRRWGWARLGRRASPR